MDFRGLYVLISQFYNDGLSDVNRYWISIIMAILVILLCLLLDQGVLPTVLSVLSYNFYWSISKRKCITTEEAQKETAVVPGIKRQKVRLIRRFDGLQEKVVYRPSYYAIDHRGNFIQSAGEVTQDSKLEDGKATSRSADENDSQDSPTVTERPKKFSRKLKKKKNSLTKSKYKNMDDSSDSYRNEAGQKVDLYPIQERTKVYTPLQLFLEINMDVYPLYHEFKLHILNEKELKIWGFPLDSPENPGRISPDPKALKSDDPTKRHCCRCEGLFYVLPDGQYHCETTCRYHAKKRLPYRGIPGAGVYPCCNGDYLSEGCERWPYHVSAESFLEDVEFLKARGKRHLTETKSCTVFALDCEMCYTTAGMEVTKVGIVGVDGLTLYESFVLPQKQILDYNTIYSGVTANDLNGVTTTLMDVQAYILKLINKDTILVGHALENDLKALRLIHENVVDTSVVFPHIHGHPFKRSLKALAEEFLNKPIQEGPNGHDCIEDARTCMELMLWKIHSDLKVRAPVIQDENKNSIIQNMPNTYGPLPTTWSCFAGNSNSNQISRFYSDFCTRRVVY